MSCCLVSADPLVGKKFSSSNETCKINVYCTFLENLNANLSFVFTQFLVIT